MTASVTASIEHSVGEPWTSLIGKRVYFGHQSVGDNILAGVSSLLLGRPNLKWPLRESSDVKALAEPGLTHSKIGLNRYPLSKIEAFVKHVNAGAGDRVDAALLKLCYVDIEEEADPRQVFRLYVDAMETIEQRYPDLRILHCTVPLTSIPGGLKNAIKRLIRRPIWGYEHNRRRGVFNALMRDKYAAAGSLFDVARAECTLPDGKVCEFAWAGGMHEALNPGYTNDGGHLNVFGRQAIGRQFLNFLARALS